MLSFFKRKIHNLVSDEKFSEILTGSAWALGGRIIATSFGMVTSIIIARYYGAEVLGIVAVLQSFLMLTTIFTALGTGTSILRLIPEHLAKYSPTSAFKVYRKTQYFVACLSVVTGAALFFCSGFIANTVFSKPNLRNYFALAAAFVMFKSLMLLNTQAVRGIRLIRVFAFMHILPALSKLVILAPITIFFFHRDNPIYAMFASITITALAGAFIMHWVFTAKKHPDDILYPTPMKEILTLSIPMLMSTTMVFFIGETGVIILGMLRTEADVGYYSAAVKLATLTTFMLTAINSIAAPKFSELFHTEKMEELFHIARKSSKLIFWVTTPLLFLLVIMGNVLLVNLFGKEFTVAYEPMLFLILGQFVNSASGSNSFFMNMTGHQKVFRNVLIMAAALNVLLNIVLIPYMGILGAAISGMVSLIFWNVYSVLYIKLKYGKTICYIPGINRF